MTTALDEHAIAGLAGAPVDRFGVGTALRAVEKTPPGRTTRATCAAALAAEPKEPTRSGAAPVP